MIIPLCALWVWKHVYRFQLTCSHSVHWRLHIHHGYSFGTSPIGTCSIDVWREYTVQFAYYSSRMIWNKQWCTNAFLRKDINPKGKRHACHCEIQQYLQHTSATIISTKYSTITGLLASLCTADAFRWGWMKMFVWGKARPAFIWKNVLLPKSVPVVPTHHFTSIATITSSWIFMVCHKTNKDKTDMLVNMQPSGTGGWQMVQIYIFCCLLQ